MHPSQCMKGTYESLTFIYSGSLLVGLCCPQFFHSTGSICPTDRKHPLEEDKQIQRRNMKGHQVDNNIKTKGKWGKGARCEHINLHKNGRHSNILQDRVKLNRRDVMNSVVASLTVLDGGVRTYPSFAIQVKLFRRFQRSFCVTV